VEILLPLTPETSFSRNMFGRACAGWASPLCPNLLLPCPASPCCLGQVHGWTWIWCWLSSKSTARLLNPHVARRTYLLKWVSLEGVILIAGWELHRS